MKCSICQQENLDKGLLTLTFERSGTTVVVKEVPGLVCPNCGEEYVSDETAAHALETAEAAAGGGSSVTVLRYQAA
jgi:YgiT-type zinc finger domain-containing protein